jgi:hypothetical protein
MVCSILRDSRTSFIAYAGAMVPSFETPTVTSLHPRVSAVPSPVPSFDLLRYSVCRFCKSKQAAAALSTAVHLRYGGRM